MVRHVTSRNSRRSVSLIGLNFGNEYPVLEGSGDIELVL